MESDLGSGLASLGFWLFIAAVVVGGIWGDIRKREAQHETLRRVIDSGQPIDAEVTGRLLRQGSASEDLDRDLRVAGWICAALVPGMAVFAWVLGTYVDAKVMPVLLGVSALLAFIAAGLMLAAWSVARHHRDDLPRDHG